MARKSDVETDSKERLLAAVAMVWQIRAKRRGEPNVPQSNPAFWHFLDEAHLKMELQQGMATLAENEAAEVRRMLSS